jgi:AcrR family transcriptional regulator
MKKESKINLEEKIKEAAVEVFTRKGLADTKTRDIAAAANINISTLHYYYRSKDKLFQIVAADVFKQSNAISEGVFKSRLSFKEKIRLFVEEYIEFCKKNPNFPSFLIFESERNPDKIYGATNFSEIDTAITIELNELIEKKVIRPITYANFIVNLISLTIYPFIASHMLHEVTGLTKSDFNEMLETRKKMIPEMIIDNLYLKKVK